MVSYYHDKFSPKNPYHSGRARKLVANSNINEDDRRRAYFRVFGLEDNTTLDGKLGVNSGILPQEILG